MTGIFISYSNDSDPHGKRVLALSNKLRNDGLDCVLGQYEADFQKHFNHQISGDTEPGQPHFYLVQAVAEANETPSGLN